MKLDRPEKIKFSHWIILWMTLIMTGYFRVKEADREIDTARFFLITSRLPVEIIYRTAFTMMKLTLSFPTQKGQKWITDMIRWTLLNDC